MSPFEFKFEFPNVKWIWIWFQKQSCRTFDFEQLLFLEIFELLWNFESNLWILENGNSVILMNSVHRSCYMPANFDLLPVARVAVRASRWRAEGFVVASLRFLGCPIKLWSRRRSSFPLLCFLPVTLLISGEPVPSLSCSAIADKLAPAPPTPCASS